jgi:WD40 repeat protein
MSSTASANGWSCSSSSGDKVDGNTGTASGSSGSARRDDRRGRDPGPVSFAPDGKSIAADLEGGNRTRKVVVLDATTGEVRFSLAPGQCPALAPDGRHLAAGVRNGDEYTVSLYDLGTNQAVKTFGKFKGRLFNLRFAPDGRTLVGENDSNLRVWDVATGSEVAVLSTHEGFGAARAAFAFSPDGKLLASVNSGFLKVWDVTRLRRGLD